MSKVLLLFALLSFSPFVGKAQEHFFSNQVVDDYFMAYDLNEKKEYIKAFDVLKKVEMEMDNSLSQKGITVTDLHEDDFLMPYCVSSLSASIYAAPSVFFAENSLIRQETD